MGPGGGLAGHPLELRGWAGPAARGARQGAMEDVGIRRMSMDGGECIPREDHPTVLECSASLSRCHRGSGWHWVRPLREAVERGWDWDLDPWTGKQEGREQVGLDGMTAATDPKRPCR